MTTGSYDFKHGVKLDYIYPSLKWLLSEYKRITSSATEKPLSSSDFLLYEAIQIMVDKGLYKEAQEGTIDHTVFDELDLD